VNELLELSRLERKTIQLDLHPQNMQAFMSQYVDLFKHQAGLLGIQLSIEATFEKPVYSIDAPKTGKIIQNLINNALKYCPRGTNLQVRIAIRDETCSIIVKDDGPGIDPVYHERIFEKFYQVPDQQQHHDPGSGLSMVKEYVDLMHGTIELNSRRGQGAEFRIVFPVREFNDLSSPEVADITDNISELETPFFQVPEGASILVVEDNAELRLYLENILHDHFRVASVANGREAIEWLKTNRIPDLILSDIMMPEMDGLELLEWIRHQEPYAMLPFIFLTAKNQDHTRLRALRLGVDDYIHKPFSDLELVLRISRLLHHAQVRQLEHSGSVEEDASLGEIPRENATILQVQEFIRMHMTDPTFNASAVAEYIGVSERTLRRFIRRETGMSTKELITEVQLDQLRRLREEYPHDTITSLSARVGYTDPKYMARIFYERWGYRL
jgi:CheY-like chemotaxis protein/AraC-like DNA-binding protein